MRLMIILEIEMIKMTKRQMMKTKKKKRKFSMRQRTMVRPCSAEFKNAY